MDSTHDDIHCRMCGRLLKEEELISPFALCTTCRGELKVKPKTLQEFTAYLIVELMERPGYKAVSPDIQEAARRNIIQAGLDATIEASDNYLRAQMLRNARRSTGRSRGRPAQQTIMTEQEFREALAAHLMAYPHDNKTQTASALSLGIRTLDNYLIRWNINPPAHWRGRPHGQTRK